MIGASFLRPNVRLSRARFFARVRSASWSAAGLLAMAAILCAAGAVSMLLARFIAWVSP